MLTAASSGIAEAQTIRRVGVMVGVRVNVDPPAADAIAAELGAALRASLPIDVIAGEDATRRLPAEGVSQSCVAELECRLEMGRRLDADELLFLVIVRMGDTIQIDATWADISSGKTASRPAIELGPDADRAAVFARNAPLLLPHITKDTGEKGRDIVVVTNPGTTMISSRHMTSGAWIATGAGVAALTAGTILALSAKRSFEDLDKMGCRDMPCAKGDIDSLERRALAADVLFGVTAAAAVTAIVLYVRSGGEETIVTPPPSVGVEVGAGAVSVTVGGWF
ncbi:MAG TPA: hypothetical protein VML75_22785 [Kofleriaceae bacterium]|nr:hypothetical protein [Kofleriaceae bacterium]